MRVSAVRNGNSWVKYRYELELVAFPDARILKVLGNGRWLSLKTPPRNESRKAFMRSLSIFDVLAKPKRALVSWVVLSELQT